VAAGADRRLDGRPFESRGVHAPDGLAGSAPADDAQLVLSPSEVVIRPHAVVVSLGPLTSLVTASAGRVVASFARPGETNHDLDPAAAQALARSGRDVEHLTTGQDPITSSPADVLERVGDPVNRLAARLLRHQAGRGAGLGDAAVMLSLAEPTLDPLERTGRLVELLTGSG
jgi:hypothetical protein